VSTATSATTGADVQQRAQTGPGLQPGWGVTPERQQAVAEVLGGLVPNKVPPGSRLPWEPGAPGRADAAGCSFAPLSAPKGYQAALALPGLRLIRYQWGPAAGDRPVPRPRPAPG